MSRSGKSKQHGNEHQELSVEQKAPETGPSDGVLPPVVAAAPAEESALTGAPACSVESGAAAQPSAEAPAEQLRTQMVRLQADFDNFRKRVIREKTEIYDRTLADLCLELLPVVDHFYLAVEAARQHQAEASIVQGFQLILDQLMGVLGRWGLTPFDTQGQAFDPNRCDAVNYMVSADQPEGIVVAQPRRGYMLKNRVIRPAQVVVSSGAAKVESVAPAEAGAQPAKE